MKTSVASGPGAADPGAADPAALLVGEAVKIIDARACRGLGVQQLADELGVSRRWLAKWFPPTLGCSPHEAIRRAVFRRVEALLRHTDLTIAEIAVRAGFKHHEYLAAAFQRRYGIPPGRWRRQSSQGGRPGRTSRSLPAKAASRCAQNLISAEAAFG